MKTRFQVQLLCFLSLLWTNWPTLSTSSMVGVCYGMVGDNLPSPIQAINLLKAIHIQRTRLYEPNIAALQALQGSGIQVILGVRDDQLQQLADSYAAANDWVAQYVRPYWPRVHFRYIAVGNEVIPGSFARYVLPAMKNLHKALRVGGLWHHIKVSTSVAISVMGESYPPSKGMFSLESRDHMVPIVRHLSGISAPLLVNVYPYFSYIEDSGDISLNYAMFKSSNVVVQDGELSYYNLFDAMVDAIHSSLENAGAPGVPVVVSETGWPSDGDGQVASVANAQTYNTEVVRHVLSGNGTPKWPGKPIETYLFAMFNENLKTGAAVEKHWGLFHPDMTPVYSIDFQ